LSLFITGDADADRLLNTDGFALLAGMLLDQQVPMEWAFRGPATMKDRLGHLDPARIAAMTEDDLVAVARQKPAFHRFPVAMARRLHAIAVVVTERYDGRAESLWVGAASGAELYRRLRELPGFGDEKAKIFIALLAKRFGVRPAGWKRAAGVFADTKPRSVADCADAETLAQVRRWKLAQKAAQKDKQDRPLNSPRPN
jgi:uncharacterized HhH-GPD family protein